MGVENLEAELPKEKEFVLGDRVEFLGDGRKGTVVEENSQSLLPEGIIEVKFDGETGPEGVQTSDLRKAEEGEDEIEEKGEGEDKEEE